MSGPIVRRYGFPNFEKIFGERDLQHGEDESMEGNVDTVGEPTGETPSPKSADKPKPAAKPKKKKS